MVAEKLDLFFDVTKLIQHLNDIVMTQEMVRCSPSFGGWSVLSSDGTYQDGWQPGHLLLAPNIMEKEKIVIQSTIPRKFSDFTLETEICTGYLLKVIDRVRSLHFKPYRARIICLSPGGESVWHRDARDDQYAVRLHIPILTNEGCFFETLGDRAHLPADGSAYALFVNREHRIVNHGKTPRYHLVMNIVDESGVTKFHCKSEFFKKRESPASLLAPN